MAKKVALIIAYEGYNTAEYQKIKQHLEQHGIRVVTTSTKLGHALSSEGKTTKVEAVVAQLDPLEYGGLVIIGGQGVAQSLYCDQVYEAIQRFNMAGKVLGGICSGTRVLAKAGGLVSRVATGWNEDGQLEELYREHGVIFQDEPVLIDTMDKRVVTARDVHQADAFATALLEVL